MSDGKFFSTTKKGESLQSQPRTLGCASTHVSGWACSWAPLGEVQMQNSCDLRGGEDGFVDMVAYQFTFFLFSLENNVWGLISPTQLKERTPNASSSPL